MDRLCFHRMGMYTIISRLMMFNKIPEFIYYIFDFKSLKCFTAHPPVILNIKKN